MTALSKCRNLDYSAGLVKPCITAPGREEHWCDVCLLTEVRRLQRIEEAARVIRSHETHPPRSEAQAVEEWESFCEALEAGSVASDG